MSIKHDPMGIVSLDDPAHEVSRNRYLAAHLIDPGTITAAMLAPGVAISGPPGPQGERGADGRDGAPGSPGVKGDTGERGLPGADGAVGTPGAKGDTGTAGSPGAEGDPGDPGTPGAKGDQGDPGGQGIQGIQGPAGAAGLGYAINVQALTSSPGDSQTVYFGMLPKAPTTTANISRVYIRQAGVIKRAEIYCYSGTAGTNEAWSLYIRKNNTTDTLIKTLNVNTNERLFTNAALNIAVAEGDYFEIKGVQPLWATNPATCIYGGYIYVEAA